MERITLNVDVLLVGGDTAGHMVANRASRAGGRTSTASREGAP